MSQFKQEHSLEKRTEVASKIRTKYADRIPVIVEKNPKDNNAPPIDKKKFLVPQDITVGRFVHEIKRHMPKLKAEDAIFLFVGDTLPPTSSLMSTIYETYKDDDGFLYITYSGENTFGNGTI